MTVDALRTLLGDRQLGRREPTLIDSGVLACALTTLQRIGEGWTVRSIAATDHLSGRGGYRHLLAVPGTGGIQWNTSDCESFVTTR